jgi:hypothetical protein
MALIPAALRVASENIAAGDVRAPIGADWDPVPNISVSRSRITSLRSDL